MTTKATRAEATVYVVGRLLNQDRRGVAVETTVRRIEEIAGSGETPDRYHELFNRLEESETGWRSWVRATARRYNELRGGAR